MGEVMKQILTRPLQLADQITKATNEAKQFKPECLELQAKTKKLADLIRQAARARNDLYERPTRRILDNTEQVLEKALSLVDKCRARSLIKRVFSMIPSTAFRKIITQLDSSIGDVSWLLRVSATKSDDNNESDIGYLGLPPIATNEPILCLIWESIANLSTGTSAERADAAASLVSLARDNERYGKLIIEEGGVGPLLKLLKEGKPLGQEHAARCIGLLGRDQENVEVMVDAGVCCMFAKILKDGPMKVQAVVAWAVAEMADCYPKCQDHFAQYNVIRLLVSHLAFETIEEHSRYVVTRSKKMSIHGALLESKGLEVEKQKMAHLVSNSMKQSSNNKGRELEDPKVKTGLKAMAARALWLLAKGNAANCSSITESRAMLCFAVLLAKGDHEVKYNSAMAIMEITNVAEENMELRKIAFKPTSPAVKAMVDQLLRVISEGNSELLIPCVRSLGNLSRTFRATETRIIEPLVKLLDEKDTEVMLSAISALLKFASLDNYLHIVHCKSIVEVGGVKRLVQLVYFGEEVIRIPALLLLCYIALNVPDNEALAQDEVFIVLEWATKQAHIMQDPHVDDLLFDAMSRLELYQSRGSIL